MGEIIERPVRGAAFHAEGEWAIPEGYEAEVKDGKIIVRKKESEGEVIRKAIISALEKARDAHSLVGLELERAGATYPKAFAWLEKQKEQKPAEWSEEDEVYLRDALWCVEEAEKHCKDKSDRGACWSAERWLKLRRPVKQEWSEEDEKMLDGCVNNLIELKNRFGEGYGRVGDCIAWLKSRRPNSNKRPTEEE